ncbi:MAG TPA: molybdopterin molybdotransferase MoeA [Solirubrobacteraceae bacterium]|nr:molybdopterin molybdotransferase MoeA [Solirubrobacteraceae bacterium]
MAAAGREFFTVRTVAEALRSFRPAHRTGVETVALADALRRVPAADLRCAEPLPAFDRSAVDGYAVQARDTHGASDAIPSFLRVIGEVRMGSPAPGPLAPATAIAIPTGGALPEGADAVVMVEHTQPAVEGFIEVVRAVAPGDGVVRAGEDAGAGEVVARAGRPLRAQEIALLAACGITEVSAHARPRVAIIATGDEIVAPQTATLGPGQVRDALSDSVAALVREAGGIPQPWGIVRDDPGLLREALAAVLDDQRDGAGALPGDVAGTLPGDGAGAPSGDGAGAPPGDSALPAPGAGQRTAGPADAVVVCAGSSVGARDGTATAIASVAELWCHGLAIKPGKPTLLADAGGVPIIGLPGNPRSALVVFRLIGMDLIRQVGGVTEPIIRPSVVRRLSRDLPSAAGRLDVVQVRLRGELAEPLFGPSALLSVMTAADGWLIVEEDANGLAAGEQVEVFLDG